MKIALAHRQLELKGGTERVLYRTAEGLRDRGHEVHLFCGAFRIPPPPGVAAHRVPCLHWPRTLRLLSFAFWAPKVMARFQCDVVMSFTRMVKQDIFRSGGGPHRAFIDKMMRSSGILRRLWYRLSPYHRCVLAIERRQLSSEGCAPHLQRSPRERLALEISFPFRQRILRLETMLHTDAGLRETRRPPPAWVLSNRRVGLPAQS